MASERSLARTGALALALSLSLLGGPAWAEPSAAAKETARSLMDDGDKKMTAGDLRAALKAYQAADDIMRVPTTAIAVARAQAKLGLLVEARDTLQRLMRTPAQPGEPAPFVRARSEAERLDDQLQKRIPSLKVSVRGLANGVAPEVFVDGEAIPATAIGLPRKSNPGAHHIVASARGYESASSDLTLAEGDNREVSILLKALPEGAAPLPPPRPTAPAPLPPPPAEKPTAAPAPAPLPPPALTAAPASDGVRRPVLVYGGFGLGALGIAVGGVSGILALSKGSAAKSHCEGTRCTEAAQDDLSTARGWARAANISFAVGAVGAGVGLVALLTGDRKTTGQRPRVEPLIGLNQAGIRGQF